MNPVGIDAYNIVKAVLKTEKTHQLFHGLRSLDSQDLRITSNSLDLVVKPYIYNNYAPQGEKYERKCFNESISKDQNTLVFGPNLTDYLLGSSPVSRFHRPDAIKFFVEDDKWTVIELHEYKSSRRNHNLRKKLFGFKDATDFFRSNPAYLPELIRWTLSDIIVPPAEIIIPDNKDITVTFVYPNRAALESTVDLPFLVNYKKVRP